MVNTQDFIRRLQKIIDYYGLSAASFADKVGVQRSSISHLLSGRNKPSLDFVMKVLTAFPEVDMYWLLNGKGVFPTSVKTQEKTASPRKYTTLTETEIDPSKEIDRIIIFYKDGSFKNYEN